MMWLAEYVVKYFLLVIFTESEFFRSIWTSYEVQIAWIHKNFEIEILSDSEVSFHEYSPSNILALILLSRMFTASISSPLRISYFRFFLLKINYQNWLSQRFLMKNNVLQYFSLKPLRFASFL